MEQLRGGTALVTGASGGIGRSIALALGREGMDVALSGRREDALASVADALRATGVRAAPLTADLADPGSVDPLVERAEAALGPLDVLVNNAGIEITSAFTRYTREELLEVVNVNLTAALLLTHRVVPGMVSRGRGHVVFLASTAGKVAPAYQAPYAATKAALIGLSQSLRNEYARSPVGFSAVAPGFVAGDGMYQRMVEQGHRSNRVIGETTVERVVERVIDAIKRDRPETVESGAPLRPLLAASQVSPRVMEWAVARVGANELFRGVAADRGRLDPGP
jgi:short-subunit dehydrogenase